MIVETLVTTINDDETTNIAPMGPVFPGSWERFELRPFMETRTFANLNRMRQGVLHLSDNSLWFANAVVNEWDVWPEMAPAESVRGWRLLAAQQAIEFEVIHIATSPPRANLQCRLIQSATLNPWRGHCRATFAIVECAIVATRLQFLPAEEVFEAYSRGCKLVQKTGGVLEHRALAKLVGFVERAGVDLKGLMVPVP
jgi:hypothetical protein